jgi:hypothetical protein
MTKPIKAMKSTKEADESFKNCNIERLIETLIKIIERRENVKITYEFRKKTEEELKAESLGSAKFEVPG